MRKSKYVIGLAKVEFMEKLLAVIFPEDIKHDDMARLVFGCASHVIGGGFCNFYQGEVEAYGESISLGLQARQEDTYYLSEALGLIAKVPGDIARPDYDKVYEQIREATSKVAAVGKIDVHTLPRAANE